MGYIIATSRFWHEPMAARLQKRLGKPVALITQKKDLNFERLMELQPRFIFFPHWSYLIPAEIAEEFECVIFHMTDLPFGRGGSPLQNLISRGIYSTQLTALRCAAEIDAGPVYLKRPLSLHGSAEEIFLRTGKLTEEMIIEIAGNEPEPVPQEGEPTTFKRRTPEQSRITEFGSLDRLFDHIRMLDATGYPKAFLEHAGFRFEFERVIRRYGKLIANVNITEVTDE
jgi:methionyl-tRNA formyltransferase